MKTLHLSSGLPRAGSTLLASILSQNEDIHADIISPIRALSSAVLTELSGYSENAQLVDNEGRKRLLRGLFESYYADKNVVFDANRSWTAHTSLIAELYPDAKIVCMVRDVRWIMDSIERLIIKNPFYLSNLFGSNPNTTVFGRVGQTAAGDGLVGAALNSLKQAYFGPLSDRLVIIRYEDFVQKPEKIMTALYDVLKLKPFKHDFDNVAFKSEAFDMFLNTPGLHTVTNKVVSAPRTTILPPEIFNYYTNSLAFLNSPSKAVQLK